MTTPDKRLHGFTVTTTPSGAEIQIDCPDCGTFFEMPAPVELVPMIQAADEHECDEEDADDHA